MTADFPFECDGCGTRREVLSENDGWTKREIGDGRGMIVEYLCPDCQGESELAQRGES
jgi:hypothetical protein